MHSKSHIQNLSFFWGKCCIHHLLHQIFGLFVGNLTNPLVVLHIFKTIVPDVLFADANKFCLRNILGACGCLEDKYFLLLTKKIIG